MRFSPSQPAPVAHPSVFSAERLLVGAFFLALYGIALLIHDDYGISWDEPSSRENGLITLNYLRDLLHLGGPVRGSEGLPPFDQWVNRDYGVVFELPAVVLERLLNLSDPQAIYRMRHLMTFTYCWISLLAFYQVAKQWMGSWEKGLVGCLLLVATPRLLADSFYNMKDLVFLSFCVLALWSLFQLLRHFTLRWVLIHGLMCALATDVRILGVFTFVVTLIVLGLRVFAYRQEMPRRWWVIYGGAYGLFTYVAWPHLWDNPLMRFKSAFAQMMRFRWEDNVLYRGEFVLSTDLPWHYLPTWIVFTTPIPCLIFLSIGLGWACHRLLRRPLFSGHVPERLQIWALLGFSIGPLLAVILLHSVVYNGWRHLYFVYPPLVLLSLAGLDVVATLLARANVFGRRIAFALLGLLAAAPSMIWAVRQHPHQYVYFNALAGSEWSRRFDADYWGVSYKSGLEYLLRRYPVGKIRVAVANPPGEYGVFLLDPADRARIEIVHIINADLFISNIQYGFRNQGFVGKQYPYAQPVMHEVRVDGQAILGIFALKPGSLDSPPR